MNATERFGASDTYTELRTLGEGASGKVVLARHDASGELVAIKHLAPRLVQDEAFLERFRGEAEILSSLRHPNIAGLHWYVESESEALLAIEAVNGVPLRRLLETGPTEPEAALVVLQGSLRGLHYAHDVDIVHRDYKPENVLVETDGNSRLIDFGIAVPVGESGVLAGTPRYMAPEQWQNGEATPQTDVYAAAAVCYECLVGERPFEATTLTELRTQHLTAAVPLEKLPEALRDLIARGMAKDSAERFETAGAFLAELEVVAAAAYGPDWAERGRKALAAAVAALALLLPLTAPAGAVAAGGGTTIAATVLGGVLLLAGCITAVVLTTHHGSSPVLAAAPGSPPTSTSSTMPSTSTSTSTSRTGSSSSSRSSASPASSGSSSTSTRSSGSSSAGGSGSAKDTTGSKSTKSTPTSPSTPGSSSSSSSSPTGSTSSTSTTNTSTTSGSSSTPPPGVPAGVITGMVIDDANGNGVADQGETGIAGVMVTLTRGGSMQPVSTDSTGAYAFTGLSAGTYTISYGPPPGYVNTGTAPVDVLLNAGQNLSGPAFLAQLRTASIGGSVLDSTTHAGISGVSVHLSDGANTTTDSSGGYLFGGLAAGRYDVGFTPPPGYVNVGSNPITATLSAGQAVTAGDFAAAPNVGSISVVVCQGWSGKCSGPGLAGVGVVVTNVVSGTTDGSGAAGFSGLTPGTYTVDYAPPGNYINTGSQPQTVTVTGLHTASVTFTAQPNVGTIDVQVCTPGSSAGTCYALSGISVSVQGPTTASGTTDSAGNAVFGGLAAGTYSVGYTPSGCTPDRSTPNPQTVTVSFGQTVSVVFSCWVLL